LDNNKESFYIQFSLDGLVKVPENIKTETIEKISLLLTELLKIDGMISSKENLNIISEFEVAVSILNNEILH